VTLTPAQLLNSHLPLLLLLLPLVGPAAAAAVAWRLARLSKQQ
jgi:hypothetical protein